MFNFKLSRLTDTQRNTTRTAAAAAMYAAEIRPSETNNNIVPAIIPAIIPDLDITVDDPGSNINSLDFGKMVKPTPFQNSLKSLPRNTTIYSARSSIVPDIASLNDEIRRSKTPRCITFGAKSEDDSSSFTFRGSNGSILKKTDKSRFVK